MGTDWLYEEGIRTDWKLFASGPDIVKAFEKGEIDVGYIGMPPAIIGMDRNVPIICVAGGHVEGTVLIAQRNYMTLDELKDVAAVLEQFEGKTIGCPPKGSIHDVIINNALKEVELDIKVKNFAWTDFVLEALVDGEIEAAAGTPPLAVAAARTCGAKIVIGPKALWPDNPSYGIVIKKELMQHPDLISAFLKNHERASNFIRTAPRDAARIVARQIGIMDEDFVLEAYRISPKYCSALSREYIRSTMTFVPVLHRLKYISRYMSEDEIFDRSLIDEVHREPPHYNL
jgi:NitT/TauT family transport system substrate-binding protein